MPTDHQLLQDTAAGDRAAFGRLVERHQDAVMRVARIHAPDAVQAEGVLQETFIEALRSAGSYSGTGSVRGWLLTIARRRAFRRYRRRVGEPSAMVPLHELGDDAGWGDADNPERLAAAAEDIRRVRQALASLPEADREILVLRELEQLSGPETAEALGLSLTAMKSRLHRARLKLMAALRSEETSHA